MTRKDIPTFSSEEEERDFWATHDATDYVDFTQSQRAQFPELRPSAKTISLRLPVFLLDSLKVLAHKRDVPYQSLIKLMLADAIQRERTAGDSTAR
jgi:predicted DNA binding CopG/RHH family protein